MRIPSYMNGIVTLYRKPDGNSNGYSRYYFSVLFNSTRPIVQKHFYELKEYERRSVTVPEIFDEIVLLEVTEKTEF